MKRILLVYLDEQTRNNTEREHSPVESAQLVQDLNSDGCYDPAAGPPQASTATSRQVCNAMRFVTEGPFLGTREQLNTLAGLQTELL